MPTICISLWNKCASFVAGTVVAAGNLACKKPAYNHVDSPQAERPELSKPSSSSQIRGLEETEPHHCEAVSTTQQDSDFPSTDRPSVQGGAPETAKRGGDGGPFNSEKRDEKVDEMSSSGAQSPVAPNIDWGTNHGSSSSPDGKAMGSRKTSTKKRGRSDAAYSRDYLRAETGQFTRAVSNGAASILNFHQPSLSRLFCRAKQALESRLYLWFVEWSGKMDFLVGQFQRDLSESLDANRESAQVDGTIHRSEKSFAADIDITIERENGDLPEVLQAEYKLLVESCEKSRSRFEENISRDVKDSLRMEISRVQEAYNKYGLLADEKFAGFRVDDLVDPIVGKLVGAKINHHTPMSGIETWWSSKVVPDLQEKIAVKKLEVRERMIAERDQYLEELEECRKQYAEQQAADREARRRAEARNARREQTQGVFGNLKTRMGGEVAEQLAVSLSISGIEKILQDAEGKAHLWRGPELGDYQNYSIWEALTRSNKDLQSEVRRKAGIPSGTQVQVENDWRIVAKYITKKTKTTFGFLEQIWLQVRTELENQGHPIDGDMMRNGFCERLRAREQNRSRDKLFDGLDVWVPVSSVTENVLVQSFIKSKIDPDGVAVPASHRYTVGILVGRFN